MFSLMGINLYKVDFIKPKLRFTVLNTQSPFGKSWTVAIAWPWLLTKLA